MWYRQFSQFLRPYFPGSSRVEPAVSLSKRRAGRSFADPVEVPGRRRVPRGQTDHAWRRETHFRDVQPLAMVPTVSGKRQQQACDAFGGVLKIVNFLKFEILWFPSDILPPILT